MLNFVKTILLILLINNFVYAQDVSVKGVGATLKDAYLNAILEFSKVENAKYANLLELAASDNPEKYIESYKIISKDKDKVEITASVDKDSLFKLLNINFRNLKKSAIKIVINNNVKDCYPACSEGQYANSQFTSLIRGKIKAEVQKRNFQETNQNDISLEINIKSEEGLNRNILLEETLLDTKAKKIIFTDMITFLENEIDTKFQAEALFDKRVKEEKKDSSDIVVTLKKTNPKCNKIVYEKIKLGSAINYKKISYNETTFSIKTSKKVAEINVEFHEAFKVCQLKFRETEITDNKITYLLE